MAAPAIQMESMIGESKYIDIIGPPDCMEFTYTLGKHRILQLGAYSLGNFWKVAITKFNLDANSNTNDSTRISSVGSNLKTDINCFLFIILACQRK